EVTLRSEAGIGVDLRDGRAKPLEPVGVEGGLDVAFHDAQAHGTAQPLESAPQDRGLAGSRGTHHSMSCSTNSMPRHSRSAAASAQYGQPGMVYSSTGWLTAATWRRPGTLSGGRQSCRR